MVNTSKCVACGGDTVPIKAVEKMYRPEPARVKIEHAVPPVPPFSLFICSRCGYWNMFSLELRESPRKLSKDEAEKIKKMQR